MIVIFWRQIWTAMSAHAVKREAVIGKLCFFFIRSTPLPWCRRCLSNMGEQAGMNVAAVFQSVHCVAYVWCVLSLDSGYWTVCFCVLCSRALPNCLMWLLQRELTLSLLPHSYCQTSLVFSSSFALAFSLFSWQDYSIYNNCSKIHVKWNKGNVLLLGEG